MQRSPISKHLYGLGHDGLPWVELVGMGLLCLKFFTLITSKKLNEFLAGHSFIGRQNVTWLLSKI